MAESSKAISANTENVSEQQAKQNHPNPLFSLFQNLRHIFPEQQPKQETKSDVVVVVSQESTIVTTHEVENGSNSWKPDVVKFSDARPIVPPPLKLEAEEYEESTSPAVLWQVYALGGFIVLKWIWARWNERRAKQEPSDEEPSPDDD